MTSFFRWGKANIEIRACEEHLKEVFNVLREAQRNKDNVKGGLKEALKGADVFIGLSTGGALKAEYIKQMADDPIIFALANPVPEIYPPEAKKAGARFIATGRSDFPNQVNNALVFPGLFKGAILARAKKITPRMKLAAAEALAGILIKPSVENFVPSIFDPNVVLAISSAVAKAYNPGE